MIAEMALRKCISVDVPEPKSHHTVSDLSYIILPNIRKPDTKKRDSEDLCFQSSSYRRKNPIDSLVSDHLGRMVPNIRFQYQHFVHP